MLISIFRSLITISKEVFQTQPGLVILLSFINLDVIIGAVPLLQAWLLDGLRVGCSGDIGLPAVA